ncbi:hypothetical protein PAL_GLEAN10010429 [Pteropus alecto]|uniref:Uncharacterized protein n=1 Tax=Pteropus alecto TaxID=9402 RepID=L5KJ56_PTEAL|nr:hypothetical protein PAL_GLEAN10010429 [Pteropus alecto]
MCGSELLRESSQRRPGLTLCHLRGRSQLPVAADSPNGRRLDEPLIQTIAFSRLIADSDVGTVLKAPSPASALPFRGGFLWTELPRLKHPPGRTGVPAGSPEGRSERRALWQLARPAGPQP